ncbi:MAG: hypothetical protein IJR15_03735 [Clostridiales bacterium]|nr:hypothetical protein [Clostridiales bacterium]
MAFSLSEKGIRYIKFLKSVILPFDEIRSIIITEEGTSITTNSGENYFQKELMPVSVNDEFCNYMVKYNIEYRNDTECVEGSRPYSREELEPIIERVISNAEAYADALIKERLGAGYGSKIIFREDIRWGSAYFCLTKDGAIIDVPEECMIDEDEEVPESYDNILLFFMTEWSPVNQRGYYAITEDVYDEALLKSYVEDWSGNLCEEYQDYLDEEE